MPPTLLVIILCILGFVTLLLSCYANLLWISLPGMKFSLNWTRALISHLNESHRRLVQIEGFSEYSNIIQELSQQVAKLKGDLLAESITFENLRSKNQEHRASDKSHQLIIKILKYDLVKARKERGDFSVHLSSTRDISTRRGTYLERLMEVAVVSPRKALHAIFSLRLKLLPIKFVVLMKILYYIWSRLKFLLMKSFLNPIPMIIVKVMVMKNLLLMKISQKRVKLVVDLLKMLLMIPKSRMCLRMILKPFL
ncbi:uncharacterized protein LOC113353223 [Papaver somniferum]|uniref:uncharacterized protein LOC113353223 n=1 Tax=Papaver somniferum TaxID=3469 RepID=UPI000E6FFE1D|nr:uncharacterized protein LOC113353223 [Papaver somniferum]XP_026452685.1 uncharacterized protein LOC113353223 [Papaver somniferum]